MTITETPSGGEKRKPKRQRVGATLRFKPRQDSGRIIDSVEAICLACGNHEEIWGDHVDAVTRCLATLRDTCPRGENNFYFEHSSVRLSE